MSAAMQTRSIKTIVTPLLARIVFAAIVSIFAVSCEQRVPTQSASYNDVGFTGGKNVFSAISWIRGANRKEVPDWRVVLDDGIEFYMPEVKEADVEKLIRSLHPEPTIADSFIRRTTTGIVSYHFSTWNWLSFRDGKLVSFSLANGGNPPLSKVSVGRGKTGKLYHLNFTRQQLRDAFGEPIKFERGSMHVP